ncbi:uncharacterized protein LOC131659697 [Vicia villosa]|uniref:uncharacterized protein LOC131659697 n=1 Tax=Vicia villosa TaxID=3911 RepID=UPI00273AB991|nr:uncharacterized protein LOC131659697 [Vicia villosa]
MKLWRWLENMLNLSFYIAGWLDIWRLMGIDGAVQCKIVNKVAVVSLINSIWKAQNMVRFHNNFILFSSSIASILAYVSSVGNAVSIGSHIGMEEFFILKKFQICITPPRAPKIREMLWQLPPRGWFKINCDGAATPISSACGGTSNSLIAELSGAMQAIEFAHEKNWRKVWLETDSMAVVKAFNPLFTVPWIIRNRWINCIHLVSHWNFVVSHIFREWNSCADALANFGLSVTDSTHFTSIPLFLRTDFVKNRLGYTQLNYHFFVASCNGILCIGDVSKGLVLLWNPSIRKINELPHFISLRGRSSIQTSVVKVYALGTNSWKSIPNIPFVNLSIGSSGKFVSGTINWLAYMDSEQEIARLTVSFDLGKSLFMRFCFPTLEG